MGNHGEFFFKHIFHLSKKMQLPNPNIKSNTFINITSRRIYSLYEVQLSIYRIDVIFKNILVVCIGNICRSVTAERILRSKLPGLEIHSAGVDAMVGYGIDKTASEILDIKGYECSNHKAQNLTAELVVNSDLILVMEKDQRKFIISRYPQASGKVFLLGCWDGDLEITDPYRKSTEVFEYVYSKIEKSCLLWCEKIKQ
jgi:protein-tyrosine phosphatase